MPSDAASAPVPSRFDVLGIPVSAIDMQQALDVIDGWIRLRTPHYVCITGVHGVMESQRDAELRRIHERAGLVTPDGMPLVWLAHLAGLSHVERVYGPDLMLACCRVSVERGYRHFFYGGAPGVGDVLARRLAERFPGLSVAGVCSPPFRPLEAVEHAALIDRMNEARPDIVWVGLSTPKQERWMAAHIGRLEAPVLIGVGAAFDFHAGTKRQAPRWMQRSGLEWSFRLVSEPRRLGRRDPDEQPCVYLEGRDGMDARGFEASQRRGTANHDMRVRVCRVVSADAPARRGADAGRARRFN